MPINISFLGCCKDCKRRSPACSDRCIDYMIAKATKAQNSSCCGNGTHTAGAEQQTAENSRKEAHPCRERKIRLTHVPAVDISMAITTTSGAVTIYSTRATSAHAPPERAVPSAGTESAAGVKNKNAELLIFSKML